jgi:hypothetical protein
MLPLGCHLLVEDVFDIVGAKSLMEGRPLHSVEEGLSTIVVFEGEQPLDALFQRLIGGGSVLQIPLGDFA